MRIIIASFYMFFMLWAPAESNAAGQLKLPAETATKKSLSQKKGSGSVSEKTIKRPLISRDKKLRSPAVSPSSTPAQRVTLPEPTIEITRFSARPSPTSGASTPGMELSIATARSSSGHRSDRVIVNRGDRLRFSWKIEGCNATIITGTLTRAGSINPGTRHTTRDRCFYMENQRGMNMTESGTYTLKVIGRNGSASTVVQKSVEIIVNNPHLEIQEPALNSNRELTFIVRNTGNTDMAPYPLTVTYHVTARGRSIAEDRFASPRIGIARNQRVEVGTITLPESAYNHESLSISMTVDGNGISSGRRTFTKEWEVTEFRIGRILLEGITEGLLTGARMNNYDASKRTGEVSPQEPVQRNDSWIEVLGHRSTFTPPAIRLRFQIKGAVSGHAYKTIHYRAFINNIGLGRNLPEYVQTRDKIGVDITFDTSGSREIKGFTYENNKYHDAHGPDIEITNLVVHILLRFVLLDQKITYRDVDVSVDVSNNFAGGWDVIDTFKPAISRSVREVIRDLTISQISAQLESDATKRGIEASLAALMSRRTINHFISVRLTSEGLVIRYI